MHVTEHPRRALRIGHVCLLDPYGLDLDWDVILQAGQSGAVDMLHPFGRTRASDPSLFASPPAHTPPAVTKLLAETTTPRLTQYLGEMIARCERLRLCKD
jgi:hypothetical protein